MSVFTDRQNSALVVIDVQNEVVAGAYDLTNVVSNIGLAVEKARAAGVPVVWIQHNDVEIIKGSQGWQIVDELQPAQNEPRIDKSFRSSFEGTSLEATLEELSVGHVYLCGMQTNICVRNTFHSALQSGYDVTVLTDAHTTTDYATADGEVPAKVLVNDLNGHLDGYELPGRKISSTSVSQLDFEA